MDTVFAVYSEDDRSLRFYKRDTVPSVGDMFEGHRATNVYTGIETDYYAQPWDDFGGTIDSAIVVDEGIKPVSTAHWFDGCWYLTTIDLTKLNTSSVTDMSFMFKQCVNLTTTLDVSSWDTSSVTSIESMFEDCLNLVTINGLSNWDTSSITNMGAVFAGCNSLNNLDLTSWNTSKVTITNSMFYGCSALNIIYVDDEWSNTVIDTSYNMFKDCTALIGQSGTTYNSSKVDITMANWDTGYLTYNGYVVFGVSSTDDNSLLWYRRRMKEKPAQDDTYENRTCTEVIECDLDEYGRVVIFAPIQKVNSDINKYIVVDNIAVARLADGAQNEVVKKLDVRHLDVSACTVFNGVFSALSYNTDHNACLESIACLDLSTWDTSSAESMDYMFADSSDIKKIYVGDKWSVTNVTSSEGMFANCANLIGDSGTVYDDTKTDVDMANWQTGYLSKSKLYLIQNSSLYTIANAIRIKTGSSTAMTPDEMALAITSGWTVTFHYAASGTRKGTIYYISPEGNWDSHVYNTASGSIENLNPTLIIQPFSMIVLIVSTGSPTDFEGTSCSLVGQFSSYAWVVHAEGDNAVMNFSSGR